MQQTSAEKLRSIIDTTDEHLRMLRRFNIETDHWSAMVCVLLLNKLDAESRNQWKSKEKLPEMPDLKALFEHLEQRIFAIRNVEQSTGQLIQQSTDTSKGQSKAAKANLSNSQRYHPYERNQSGDKHSGTAKGAERPKGDNQRIPVPDCPSCGNGVQHFLWRCEAFKALSPAQQLERLQQWQICEICLVAKHAAATCTKGVCPWCKTVRHNSLICPQSKGKQAE